MTTYRATVTFDLPDGDGIDTATAAAMFSDRMHTDGDDIEITSFLVTKETR